MKKLAVRVPAQLWASIQWYARQAGLVDAGGQLDISETVRDLLSRGLVTDRSTEHGYRSGYAAGRARAYADFMRGIAAATPTSARRK